MRACVENVDILGWNNSCSTYRDGLCKNILRCKAKTLWTKPATKLVCYTIRPVFPHKNLGISF